MHLRDSDPCTVDMPIPCLGAMQGRRQACPAHNRVQVHYLTHHAPCTGRVTQSCAQEKLLVEKKKNWHGVDETGFKKKSWKDRTYIRCWLRPREDFQMLTTDPKVHRATLRLRISAQVPKKCLSKRLLRITEADKGEIPLPYRIKVLEVLKKNSFPKRNEK